MSLEGNPALPHLTTEFFAWLWFNSECNDGTITVDEIGDVDVWVDDRLAFRLPGEDKARVVLTGDNPAATLEARAALFGGKLVRDMRLGLRREEREYSVTLRGVHLDLQGAKLPATAGGAEGAEELLYERMFLYEDLWSMIGALYKRFARERTSPAWSESILPGMRAWAAGE